jgi:hypothetical protein
MNGRRSRSAATERARTNVGRRCHWQGEHVQGTITRLMFHQGWPQYHIEWDDDAPMWWGNVVSATSTTLIIGEGE